MTTISDLEKRIAALTAYLLMKVDAKDWHAVQDSASDIRELVAQIEILRERLS